MSAEGSRYNRGGFIEAQPNTQLEYDTPAQTNSEVISTATQQLVSAKAINDTAKIDREHLLFGLWALDTEPKPIQY
jgi:hypothetical protein